MTSLPACVGYSHPHTLQPCRHVPRYIYFCCPSTYAVINGQRNRTSQFSTLLLLLITYLTSTLLQCTLLHYLPTRVILPSYIFSRTINNYMITKASIIVPLLTISIFCGKFSICSCIVLCCVEEACLLNSWQEQVNQS